MKDWFPLTSYDFYAHLTAGMVLLAAIDRVFMGSALAHEQHWTIVAGVFWAAAAYLVGQIVAIPSSAVLEHLLARRVLHAPSAVMLGTKPQRRAEKLLASAFGAREYAPLPTASQRSILAKVAKALNVVPAAIDAEAAFFCAFPHARSVADTATRLDTFINQYGMCRNVSFACLVAAGLLLPAAVRTGAASDVALAAGAGVLAVGLFARFIKFYATYSREVFRTFDKVVAP